MFSFLKFSRTRNNICIFNRIKSLKWRLLTAIQVVSAEDSESWKRTRWTNGFYVAICIRRKPNRPNQETVPETAEEENWKIRRSKSIGAVCARHRGLHSVPRSLYQVPSKLLPPFLKHFLFLNRKFALNSIEPGRTSYSDQSNCDTGNLCFLNAGRADKL